MKEDSDLNITPHIMNSSNKNRAGIYQENSIHEHLWEYLNSNFHRNTLNIHKNENLKVRNLFNLVKKRLIIMNS